MLKMDGSLAPPDDDDGLTRDAALRYGSGSVDERQDEGPNPKQSSSE